MLCKSLSYKSNAFEFIHVKLYGLSANYKDFTIFCRYTDGNLMDFFKNLDPNQVSATEGCKERS